MIEIMWKLLLVVAVSSMGLAGSARAGSTAVLASSTISAEKADGPGTVYSIPIAVGTPVASAALALSVVGVDEPLEVAIRYIVDGEDKCADQLTITESGTYNYDLTRAVRIAAGAGASELLCFVVGGAESTKGAGVNSGDVVTTAQLRIAYYKVESRRMDGLSRRRAHERPGARKEYVDLSTFASPNPFNPTTTISFTLPSPTRVTVQIYDIRGREVKELVDGYLVAGRWDIEWKGEDDAGRRLASGVYLYSVRAYRKSWPGKLVLLK